MNAVLQRHGARYIFVTPEGLKELMMDISREVLRSQPSNIYTFIADYCDALMITRENTRIATQVIDNLTDCSITIVDLLQRTGMSRAEAEDAAKTIQKYFRDYLERKYYPKEEDIGGEEHMIEEILRELGLPRFRAEKAQIVIKTAWQSYKERQKLFENDVEFVNWRKALRNAMFLYRRTGIPEETARRAASKIKAAYRGYYTRRYLKGIKKHHADKEIGEHGVVVYPPDVQEAFNKLRITPNAKSDLDAIIKIQHEVRRFLARQSAKRLAHDIMYNITENVQRDIDTETSQIPTDTFAPKETLTDQTFDIYSVNEEGTLYEASSKFGETYNMNSKESENFHDNSKTPDTVPTETTITELTLASSEWDHSVG